MLHSAEGLSRTAYRWALVALVAAYLLTRLPFLTRLPIFIDEATHIHWAQTALTGGWSMDGKFLSIVMIAAFVRGLPLEPLLAARLGMVAINLGVLLLVVDIGTRLGSRREGLLAGLVTVLMPFAFFYTRLALADHSMILLALLALRLSLAVDRPYSPRRAGLLALLLIGAILAKLTGALYAPVPALIVLCLVPTREWRRWIPPLVVIYVTVAAAFVGLRLRDFGAQQSDKLAAGLQWRLIVDNVRIISEALAGLLTPPLLLLIVAAIGWAVLRRRRADWLLLALTGLAILPFIVGAELLYPRYILFALGPLAILAGRFVSDALNWLAARVPDQGRRRLVWAIAWVLLAAWPLTLMARIAVDPASAPLPERVRWQYVSGWPSGYGVDEMAAFLTEQAATEPGGITLLRFPFMGPHFLSLDSVLGEVPGLTRIELSVRHPNLAGLMASYAGNRRALFALVYPVEADYLEVINQPLETLLVDATLIWEYPKPDGTSLQIWELAGRRSRPCCGP